MTAQYSYTQAQTRPRCSNYHKPLALSAAQIRAPLADDLNAIVRRARDRLAAARTGGLPGVGSLAAAAEPSVAATLDRLSLAQDEALTEEEKEAEARRKKVEAAVMRAKGGQFAIAELNADPEGAPPGRIFRGIFPHLTGFV